MERATVQLPGNHILGALSSDVFKRLRPKLAAVALTAKQVLHERNLPVRTVYFPNSGWASLVVSFEDGFQLETGLVGCEGMTGLCLSAGVDSEITEAVVQVAGDAFALEAAEFRHALETFPDFNRAVLAYSDAARSQATQWAACNGHHSLEQRLARWLLMMDDRHQGAELPVTQEVLAMMLCVHRPSVSVAAGRLQRAGLIRYAAGHLTIIDRPALGRVACECYRITKRRYPLVCK